MIDNVFINATSTRVFSVGGGSPALNFVAGTTFDISAGFLDDFGGIFALGGSDSGRLIIKPVDSFTAQPRIKLPSWTLEGEGANRRYHFSTVFDSQAIRDDLANKPSVDYEIQIEYTIAGKVYVSEAIPLTVTNSYFQSSDAPPDLPLGGPESIEWHADVVAPAEAVASRTYFGANVNRGGDVFNVRISVALYRPGLTVQLLINGETEVFTEPVAITAQTSVWTPDDEVNMLAVTSIPDGALIEVVAVFTPSEEYPNAPLGLFGDMTLRTRTTLEAEGWTWFKGRFINGTNTTAVFDDEARTVKINATGGGGGGSSPIYSAGFLQFVVGDVTYEVAATVAS